MTKPVHDTIVPMTQWYTNNPMIPITKAVGSGMASTALAVPLFPGFTEACNENCTLDFVSNWPRPACSSLCLWTHIFCSPMLAASWFPCHVRTHTYVRTCTYVFYEQTERRSNTSHYQVIFLHAKYNSKKRLAFSMWHGLNIMTKVAIIHNVV